ncbi:hypothetical protein [Umezawaea tangerina]|uniref:hypothetical protein n=1 Tax=Umezawaea tangerina TaxID=84725 RepID=UPI001FE32406|nr:hypothetical protein [Umezawaea tangerina]
MTIAMTERDEAAGASSNRYHYTRVVELAGRTVRARVERDYYVNQSCAVAEVLNDQMPGRASPSTHPPTGGTTPQAPASQSTRPPFSDL